MPELTLNYFNGRGLGELIRWIFIYGDIPFTDNRVKQEEWPEKKKTVPGGKLPVLTIDDKTLWQSLAIARYAATLAGLVPEDPVHAAFCDAIAETAKEIISEKYKIWLSEKSEEEKEKDRKEVAEKVIIPFLEKLDKKLENKEWMVGTKITWADMAIARAYDELSITFDVFTKYSKVVAHAEKILHMPKIKEWRAKRPDSVF